MKNPYRQAFGWATLAAKVHSQIASVPLLKLALLVGTTQEKHLAGVSVLVLPTDEKAEVCAAGAEERWCNEQTQRHARVAARELFGVHASEGNGQEAVMIAHAVMAKEHVLLACTWQDLELQDHVLRVGARATADTLEMSREFAAAAFRERARLKKSLAKWRNDQRVAPYARRWTQ